MNSLLTNLNLSIVLILILLIAACDEIKNKSFEKKEIIHPTSENIPEDATKVVPFSEIDDIQNHLLAKQVQRFNSLKLHKKIGSDSTANKLNSLIGEIKDITVSQSGLILLLDSRFNHIKVYDKSYNLISIIGRSGRGPGEFKDPASFTIDDRNKLYIVDKPGEVEIYQPDPKEYYVYHKTINLKYDMSSICSINGQIFLREDFYTPKGKSKNKGMLHLLSLDKEVIKTSFGKVYSSSLFAKGPLSMGTFACNPNSTTIINGMLNFPYLYGYTTTGDLKWTAVLDNYRQTNIIEKKGQSSSITYGDNPEYNYHDYTINIKNGFDDFAIVQTKGMPNDPNSGKRVQIKTYLVSFENGDGVMLKKKFGKIEYVSPKGTFYVSKEKPYPHFLVYK